MTPSSLSQFFSVAAIVFSLLAALSTAFALHYRTVAGRLQAEEISRLKPRGISEEQAAQLKTKLAERQGVVGFIYRLMDAEGSDYAEALGKVFTGAGWHVASSAGNSLNDFTGYIVATVSDDKLVPYMTFVRDSLLASGIDCRFEEIKPGTLGGPLTGDRVWLIIGRKP